MIQHRAQQKALMRHQQLSGWVTLTLQTLLLAPCFSTVRMTMSASSAFHAIERSPAPQCLHMLY